MIPTVDERLASVVRALTEVILPHLPPEASLAQEQAQLAIGHLQILRGQLDSVPAYEREELEDAKALGSALCAAIEGGPATDTALSVLAACVAGANGADVRHQTTALNKAVDGLVKAVFGDGAADAKTTLSRIILEHEKLRVLKDRKWFQPFGFDTSLEAAA